VLVDNFMARAYMTASWLVQAGWPETYVLADPFAGVTLAAGERPLVVPGLNRIRLPRVKPAEAEKLIRKKAGVIDFADSLSYKKGHIPGAWHAIRSRLAQCLEKTPASAGYVVTGDDAALTALSARDLAKLTGKPVVILEGGNEAWRAAGLPLAQGFENLSTEPDDVFRMPFLWGHYEEKAEFEEAALAYIDWELQLPAQIERAAELKFK
jgi:rhodanese-related sulfurtransferase